MTCSRLSGSSRSFFPPFLSLISFSFVLCFACVDVSACFCSCFCAHVCAHTHLGDNNRDIVGDIVTACHNCSVHTSTVFDIIPRGQWRELRWLDAFVQGPLSNGLLCFSVGFTPITF
uniref:Secreted protein n=1 Tax=Trypanosoma vivax (strain Y486) TaxID=1055687 RepID=G0UB62_TRYVY|nr:hypothetical protein TVY486_1105330 [Trypanosoma vivax Y486]